MRPITHKKFKYLMAAITVFLILGISVYLFLFSSPERIVKQIGVENAYFLMFITAIFGGFTTFNVVPYHLLLITLAAGGLNPITLGLLAATGVSLGDSTSYYVGYQGRAILPERMGKWFGKINRLGMERPRLYVIICFLYSSILPSSNDFITIPAGLARLPFWRTMLPLVLGNIVFDITLATLAIHSFDIVRTLASVF